MSKELNCMNCCIGDFKDSLCDCNNGICKEYKKVGRAKDFEKEVLNRTLCKPRTGEWIRTKNPVGETIVVCSNCGKIRQQGYDNFCGFCGTDMRGDK